MFLHLEGFLLIHLKSIGYDYIMHNAQFQGYTKRVYTGIVYMLIVRQYVLFTYYKALSMTEEDLNLHRMKLRIVTRCWFDKERFPTIKDIADATGMHERTLHRFAQDNNLPKRTKANIRRHINQSFINSLPTC